MLSFFGRNIVASEGEEWKKYRKISAPAFSDVSPRNNKMVWDETVKVMQSLFDDVWGDRETISIDHCGDITIPVSDVNSCLLNV
ncbi:hypothetical protein H0H81_005999 [Sphagnurus paluster]|uniref:Cytochrome P450 n=1 Tax=Sphagnurus paluster TaxID=117069 RepID=A0A9P7K4X8_9AGAR|nr:hypothetical protein H0H81_005999 [Sphagnurus paluster]